MGDAVSGGSSLPLVVVGVDKDRSSQGALKWALDNLTTKGGTQTLILVHVNTKPSLGKEQAKEILVPFRCFSKRRDVNCFDVILGNTDVAKAIVDFVAQSGIDKLVVGASRGGFMRSFRYTDLSSSISKSVPDFCTAYVINKGKISSVRHAARPAPTISPLRTQIQQQAVPEPPPPPPQYLRNLNGKWDEAEAESNRSPLNIRLNIHSTKTVLEKMPGRADLPFGSSCRERTAGYVFPHNISNMRDGFDCTLDLSVQSPRRLLSAGTGYSSTSHESFLSGEAEYIEAEMKRLKLELKQAMDKYKTACKDVNAAKQKATELKHWKMEGNQRIEQARLAEEVALALTEKEKAMYRAALEAADAAKWIAALEEQKRVDAERKILRAEERRGIDSMKCCSMVVDELRYRRYTIEELELATDYFAEKRKIGEGGYGPVFKCYLDHTPVAVKVLRPDAAQGQAQFQHEVEILSCIRHPNMVLLLGACPEYGCLVYEYMAYGSLEDRLFRRGNTPTIPWPARFRIAAEIATGLLFLHQTKPEPLVHRDLKPANILLDHNYVSKIGDVGLARLVPPTVADQVTQYRLTAAAGTFCYIDPEYQQTGMLGTKSDVYSLGVLLLQLVTAKPPMGLTHQVERSLEKGTFPEMLDPTVRDWPVEEASALARLALKCAELRRKDRPDLGTVVLPELNRLRSISDKDSYSESMSWSSCPSLAYDQVSVQDIRSGPLQMLSGYESSRTQYSG